MFDNAPKWFLAILLTLVIAGVPSYVDLEKRITVLETEQRLKSQSDERLLLVIDRLDVTVSQLSETTASLSTEIQNLKER